MQEAGKAQVDDTNSAAEFAKVNSRTVVGWIRDGYLPAKQLPGGRYRIRRDDLIRFLSPDEK